MMKKLFFTMLALVPLTLLAQDNTWEINEEEEVKKEAKAKPKVDEKYLKGAVPEVDGKVVFSTSINAPGKTAAQIYDILLQYMERMTKTTNQIQSKIITADADKHEITGAYQEWLVFKKTALSLDRTRFMYALNAQCSDGRADIKMTRIRYLYEEERSPQHMTAEEWITDKEAVNKKNTKLLPISGKFRRKTIDRKDFLFNKFESLLK
jgi:colicin import membrane protein